MQYIFTQELLVSLYDVTKKFSQQYELALEKERKAGILTVEQTAPLVPHKLWTGVQAASMLQNEWCNHLQGAKAGVTSWGGCCPLLPAGSCSPFTCVTKPRVLALSPSSVWDIHPKLNIFMLAWTIITEVGQGIRNMAPLRGWQPKQGSSVVFIFFIKT